MACEKLIKQLPCKTFTKRAIIDSKIPVWKRKGAQNDTLRGREAIKTVSYGSLQEIPLRGCSSVDRVLASEAKGRGFDPRQPHQEIKDLP